MDATWFDESGEEAALTWEESILPLLLTKSEV